MHRPGGPHRRTVPSMPAGNDVSYIAIPFRFTNAVTSTNSIADFMIPAGMRIVFSDITARATAVSGTVNITVGLTSATTSIVAAVALTTNLGALTVKAAGAEPAAGASIRVKVANGTGGSHTEAVVVLYGFVSQHPATFDGK